MTTWIDLINAVDSYPKAIALVALLMFALGVMYLWVQFMRNM